MQNQVTCVPRERLLTMLALRQGLEDAVYGALKPVELTVQDVYSRYGVCVSTCHALLFFLAQSVIHVPMTSI
jgi:hypothetical protein